jgi:hypothetical protein
VTDILVLLPVFHDRVQTLRLVENSFVRAVAFGDFGGGFGGMAMVTAPTVAQASDAAQTLCPDGSLQDCMSGLLIPLPVVPSPHVPADYNVFGVVSLAAGRQRAYRSHLLGCAEPAEGVLDARALVLGMEGVHAVVEVVGDDLHAVTDRLLTLTDHADVTDVTTFVAARESTAGFGARKATARRAAAKKPARPRG